MIGTVHSTAGQPVTIEGYAQDFGAAIAALQFSCDNGRTWTSFATPHTDPDCNVNWSFAFTPPEKGRYRLLVRAVCLDGRATPQPACVTVESQ
ncbi:MAG TPA: sulfite oxidase [Rubneribacter badeniensis]|uniref:Sulfite oxidase n=1 Tax=Rubneribacter badeniensis TaxID=2070688 RepID=A0A9D2VK03_9ACTN|nr:sulfite oxidase [Rubneribacter badeniensis]